MADEKITGAYAQRQARIKAAMERNRAPKTPPEVMAPDAETPSEVPTVILGRSTAEKPAVPARTAQTAPVRQTGDGANGGS